MPACVTGGSTPADSLSNTPPPQPHTHILSGAGGADTRPSAPLQHPSCGSDASLHRCAQTSQTLLDPAYWAELCPELSVEGDCMLSAYDDAEPFSVTPTEEADLRSRMERDGYFTYTPEWEPGLIERLRQGVVQLERHGWQASFISMYDEASLVAWMLHSIVSSGTGGAKRFNNDWLGYNVAGGESGMPPHRDYPGCPDDSWHDAAHRLPKICTVWIALSDASPANSCLYFLPAGRDPLYRSGACEAPGDVFATPQMFQDITAVPLRPGQVVVFSHRVYHWGSASPPDAVENRVSLAMGFSDQEYKPPHLACGAGVGCGVGEGEEGVCGVAAAFPPAAHRLALCAAQMLIYNRRHEGPWPLTHCIASDLACLVQLRGALDSQAAVLSPAYRRTVEASPVMEHLREFVRQQSGRVARKEEVLMSVI